MQIKMSKLSGLKGILFDLDGVLYVGSKVIDGAVNAVSQVKNLGYRCRFITNTSTLSNASIHAKLITMGFDIDVNEIISAPRAALIYLQQFSDPVCHLLLADDVKRDFEQFRQSDNEADFVIVGDIGDAWSYALLNQVFNLLLNGAQLIAIHKNRFWQTEQGLQMDIGGFITALEYVSQKQAKIIGKPSPDFFKSALVEMGLTSDQVAIIGDDIDSDIGGGQKAGLAGILVQTGKYRQNYTDNSSVKPDLLLASIADLPGVLPKL